LKGGKIRIFLIFCTDPQKGRQGTLERRQSESHEVTDLLTDINGEKGSCLNFKDGGSSEKAPSAIAEINRPWVCKRGGKLKRSWRQIRMTQSDMGVKGWDCKTGTHSIAANEMSRGEDELATIFALVQRKTRVAGTAGKSQGGVHPHCNASPCPQEGGGRVGNHAGAVRSSLYPGQTPKPEL